MDDESTNRRVSGEDQQAAEQLSTADLAEAGRDTPKTEITQPRVRAEDLRQALRRYRSFFGRLLSV